MSEEYEERDEAEELIKKHVEELGEHFDSVRIFVTRNSGAGDTGFCTRGTGNYFASFGQIVQWVEMEKQSAREQAIDRQP